MQGNSNGAQAKSPLPSWHGTLATEHEALGRRIAELRALTAREFSWDEVRFALVDFRKALQLHFAMEESGGYLAEVLASAPQFARIVAKLESDHGRMRGDLARLLAEAIGARERVELRASVGVFLIALAAHEHGENEVTQRTLMGDVPGGG